VTEGLTYKRMGMSADEQHEAINPAAQKQTTCVRVCMNWGPDEAVRKGLCHKLRSAVSKGGFNSWPTFVGILWSSRLCSSAEWCMMDLSMRSVTKREGKGSPKAAIAFNISASSFRSCNTCVTLAREVLSFRARSAAEE
jgi:hypothetical protein